MSLINIETITCVHIGSGEVLQYGTDFVRTTVDGERYLSVIDPRKVIDIIGENNVYNWTAAIDRRESTKDIVKRYASSVPDTAYSKRLICEYSNIKQSDTLKEHIHDGRGLPYIPGSSIKGAIRTAVLAMLAPNVIDAEERIKTKSNKVNANGMETALFGKNPNEDIFRFLQVGDAYFGNNYEWAIRMVNINERERNSFWDTSKSQVIETIGPEDESTFQLSIKQRNYQLSRNQVARMPECMQSIPNLFETINRHTIQLLETEISYWEERKDMDDSDKVMLYINKVNQILKLAKQCDKGKQCILRIGHGSGWRFITGAWTENLQNFYDVVVPAARPKNQNYSQYDFPKTRRVDDKCELLGFVKLTLKS